MSETAYTMKDDVSVHERETIFFRQSPFIYRRG